MVDPSKPLEQAFEISQEIARFQSDWEDAEDAEERYMVLKRIRNRAAKLREILSRIIQEE